MTTPTPGTYTLEEAQQDIAGLRSQLVAVQRTVATVNDTGVLLYAPGPNAIPRGPTSWSFEDGTVQGWAAGAAGAVSNSVVSAAGWPTAGTHSLLLTANGTGQPQAFSPTDTGHFIPSQPGDPVTILVDLYCPAALSHVYVGIKWRDDTGALISEVDSADTVFSAGQVQTLIMSGTAPDLTAGFAVVFGDHATDANGTLIYADNVRVQGNLAISASPGGGTDTVGNPYQAGVAAYSTAGSAVLGATQLVFNLNGNVFAGAVAPTAAVTNAAGVPGILLTSPSNKSVLGGNSQAVVGLVGESQDGTLGPYIYLGSGQFGSSAIQSIPVLVVGGQLKYAAPGVAGGNLVAETWHSLGTLANYTIVQAQYRLTPDGELEIRLNISSAGANAATTTFSVTLPAAYIPANGLGQPLAISSMTAASPPQLFVTNAGAVQVKQAASVSTTIQGCVRFPLEA